MCKYIGGIYMNLKQIIGKNVVKSKLNKNGFELLTDDNVLFKVELVADNVTTKLLLSKNKEIEKLNSSVITSIEKREYDKLNDLDNELEYEVVYHIRNENGVYIVINIGTESSNYRLIENGVCK